MWGRVYSRWDMKEGVTTNEKWRRGLQRMECGGKELQRMKYGGIYNGWNMEYWI
jgi:hypothetical protein